MRQKKSSGLVVLASLCILFSVLGGAIDGAYVFVRNTGYYLIWDHPKAKSPVMVHQPPRVKYVGDFGPGCKYDEPQGDAKSKLDDAPHN
jgi:hypothetical protein